MRESKQNNTTEEITIRVEPDADLPAPGKVMTSRSSLTDIIYELKVEEITNLRWHTDGALIVDLKAIRCMIETTE